MGGLVLGYTFFAIIAFIIMIFLCVKFADIAEYKGYSKTKYFWICFFFSVIGFAWVAALPNLTTENAISELKGKLHDLTTNNTEDGKWICIKCHTENNPNYGQCKKCGCYRG